MTAQSQISPSAATRIVEGFLGAEAVGLRTKKRAQKRCTAVKKMGSTLARTLCSRESIRAELEERALERKLLLAARRKVGGELTAKVERLAGELEELLAHSQVKRLLAAVVAPEWGHNSQGEDSGTQASMTAMLAGLDVLIDRIHARSGGAVDPEWLIPARSQLRFIAKVAGAAARVEQSEFRGGRPHRDGELREVVRRIAYAYRSTISELPEDVRHQEPIDPLQSARFRDLVKAVVPVAYPDWDDPEIIEERIPAVLRSIRSSEERRKSPG